MRTRPASPQLRALAVPVLATLALMAPCSQAQIAFGIPIQLAVASNPTAVAVADLDKDGRPDIVAGSSGGNCVNILLNQGGGRFAAPVSIPVGSAPSAIAIAELTGDAVLDLAVANSASKTVVVLRGTLARPSISFSPAVTVPVPSAPTSIAAADFDRDGDCDLVASCSGTASTVQAIRNRGAGAFDAPAGYPISSLPTHALLVDLNKDEYPDIVTSNQASSVNVLLNRKDSTFQQATKLVVGVVQYWVAAADLSGDGAVDIVTADNRSNGAQVLLGVGNGAFGAPRLFAAGNYASAVEAGDMNADGRLDLVMISQASADVFALVGNGDGTFQGAEVTRAGSSHTALALADFDQDGLLDIAVANTTGSLTVLLNATSSVKSLTFNPPTVGAGRATMMTIALSKPAPPEGLRVVLASSNPSVAIVTSPAIVAPGSASVTVPVIGGVPGTSLIAASLNGLTASATLQVTPDPGGGGLKADVNADGRVDLLDVIVVARMAGGLDVAR